MQMQPLETGLCRFLTFVDDQESSMQVRVGALIQNTMQAMATEACFDT
jgi:hypothetical protein